MTQSLNQKEVHICASERFPLWRKPLQDLRFLKQHMAGLQGCRQGYGCGFMEKKSLCGCVGVVGVWWHALRYHLIMHNYCYRRKIEIKLLALGGVFDLDPQFWLRWCQNCEEKGLAASVSWIPDATMVVVLVVWSHFNVCKGGLPLWQMWWKGRAIKLSAFILGTDKKLFEVLGLIFILEEFKFN